MVSSLIMVIDAPVSISKVTEQELMNASNLYGGILSFRAFSR